MLREGKAPGLIRRKGAEGSLAVSLTEKVEILAVLSEDPEESIRNLAPSTLAAWDSAELKEVFSHAETPVFLLDFAARHLTVDRQELVPFLLANLSLPLNLRN